MQKKCWQTTRVQKLYNVYKQSKTEFVRENYSAYIYIRHDSKNLNLQLLDLKHLSQ